MTVLVTILCSDNARALLTKNVGFAGRLQNDVAKIMCRNSPASNISIADVIVANELDEGSVFTVRLPAGSDI